MITDQIRGHSVRLAVPFARRRVYLVEALRRRAQTPNKSPDLSRRSSLAKADRFGPFICSRSPGDRYRLAAEALSRSRTTPYSIRPSLSRLFRCASVLPFDLPACCGDIPRSLPSGIWSLDLFKGLPETACPQQLWSLGNWIIVWTLAHWTLVIPGAIWPWLRQVGPNWSFGIPLRNTLPFYNLQNILNNKSHEPHPQT
jgi:hypothetical protein